jgi:hypothetical protein
MRWTMGGRRGAMRIFSPGLRPGAALYAATASSVPVAKVNAVDRSDNQFYRDKQPPLTLRQDVNPFQTTT